MAMRSVLSAFVLLATLRISRAGVSDQTSQGDDTQLAPGEDGAPSYNAGLEPPQPCCVLGEVPRKSAKEVGFTQRWGELSEEARLKLRAEAGWTWRFPGESPAYAAWQEKRYDEIQGLYHFQERLDNWVQYVQVRDRKSVGFRYLFPTVH